MITPLPPYFVSLPVSEQSKMSWRGKVYPCVISVFLIISIVGCVSALSLGLPPILVILSLVLFLLFSGALLVVLSNVGQKLLDSYSSLSMLPESETSLPRPFLYVLREVYPRVFLDFCIEKQVTIQDLRSVLTALTTGNMDVVSGDTRNKVDSFGLQRLQKENLSDLPPLEAVLIQNCPWQFVMKFISLGDYVYEQSGMTPEVYWTQSMSHGSGLHVFNHFTWLFSHVVTQDEYEQLLSNAGSERILASQDDLLKSLAERMKIQLNNTRSNLSDAQKDELRSRIICDPQGLLFYLLHLGVNWEQIQLFRQLPFDCAYLFSLYDFEINEVIDKISESSPEYDPEIALLTWSDGDPLEIAEERRQQGVL
ncbi:hypothetical protein BOKEGFJH_00401 [Chlamydia avium]|uniref:DUF1389 domain-containing protein n=1 Tax=Chlamydia avium TaxID=1457141 RepID=A0ABP2X889_9CHLA|nr:DUF1389 domain-containing protein [Chlamydia avium]EPP38204.1 hypothetical protein CP10881SC42_0826 [Chlamydia avium]VVT42880.1 hypothetical protein BOKEGFJH_00401 [Chlamydia avium]